MKNTLSYLVFALVASTSSLAFGLAVESPCDLVDCVEGEVCEVLLTPQCGCPEPAPGEGDSWCDCETQPDEAICVPAPPAPCESDTNCVGDDVCVTYSYGSCSGSSPGQPVEPNCGSDEDDDCSSDPVTRPEETCVEETESICVPKYAAPCESASDCGSGFTCETPEICTCLAGAPITCNSESPGDCEEIPRDDDCSCEPSEGDAYCQLIPVECTTDMDCQDGATCQSQHSGERATDAAIACEPDTNCEMDPIPAPSYCIPKGYGEWTNSGGTDHTDGRKAESGKRTSFFNPQTNGESGDKANAGCTVSQGPTGFAGGALILFAMMFGFRRKKK